MTETIRLRAGALGLLLVIVFGVALAGCGGSISSSEENGTDPNVSPEALVWGEMVWDEANSG